MVIAALPKVSDTAETVVGRLADTPLRSELNAAKLYRLRRPQDTAEVISLGRTADNAVQIDLASISKSHAAFHYDTTDERFQIMDSGSSNGTAVNGDRLLPGLLRPLLGGDQIVFGGWVQATFHTHKSLVMAIRLAATGSLLGP